MYVARLLIPDRQAKLYEKTNSVIRAELYNSKTPNRLLQSCDMLHETHERSAEQLYDFTPEQQLVIDEYHRAQVLAQTSDADLMKRLLETRDFDLLPTIGANRNPAYHSETNSDATPFLEERLQGNVLAVGSGDKLELKHLVPPERAFYIDLFARDQIQGITDADNYTTTTQEADHLPYDDQSFDTVYSSYFIGNPYDINENTTQHLTEQIRVLREGGRMVMRPMGNDETVRRIVPILIDLGMDPDSLEITFEQSTLTRTEPHVTLIAKPSLFISMVKSPTGLNVTSV